MRFSAKLTFFLCVTASSCAECAPLDFAQVPAGAVWVVHADFDALRQSKVYREVVQRTAHRKPLAGYLAKINGQLGMDVAEDLHGMTVFGTKLSATTAVLIMHADWDPQTFRRKMALAPEHAVSDDGRYEIHRFARNDQGRIRTVAGACWEAGTFVFGQTPGDVKLGLDVLDGRVPRLAGRASALAAEVPSGTVFLARMVAGENSLPVESPLLKHIEQIDLACGENAGACFARGRLLAKTSEGAEQAKRAIEGVLAIARLNVAGSDAAKKLLDRLQVRADGRVVRLDLDAPAADIASVLESAARQAEPAKKQ